MRDYYDYAGIGGVFILLLLVIAYLKYRYDRLAGLARVYRQDNGRGDRQVFAGELFGKYQVLRTMDGQVVVQCVNDTGKLITLIQCDQLWQLISNQGDMLLVGIDSEGCIIDILQARQDGGTGEVALIPVDFSTANRLQYICILDGGGFCVREEGGEEQVIWPEGPIQDAFGEHQLRMSEG